MSREPKLGDWGGEQGSHKALSVVPQALLSATTPGETFYGVQKPYSSLCTASARGGDRFTSLPAPPRHKTSLPVRRAMSCETE